MKPFDLEAAKAGKPVCTRNGKPARIICFDKKGSTYPLIALIYNGEKEETCGFTEEGKWNISGISDKDLFMVEEKHTGYINIYNMESSGPCLGYGIYSTKEEAQKVADPNVVDTIKIEWEEQIKFKDTKSSNDNNLNDLCIISKHYKGWILFPEDTRNMFKNECIFDSKEEAITYAKHYNASNENHLVAIKVEWDE